MNRKHVLTRNLPFTRTVTLDKERIQSNNRGYHQTMTHVTRDRVEECAADFVLEIDYDALVRTLFKKAAHSKGGKAQIASGLIRLVKRNEKLVRCQEREHPLPEGWEVQS